MKEKVLYRVTSEYLKKNKMRTLVTIAGIVLSTAMITAVIVILTSMQDYLLRETVATEGAWEGCIREMTEEELRELSGEKRVSAFTTLQSLGYARVPSTNESKPYLYVAAVTDAVEEFLEIEVVQGRMPENASELLLPVHLAVNGEVRYALGEKLELSLGERRMDGGRLGQWHWYMDEETFSETECRTYTVVGFYERPRFEFHGAPGYTALTLQDGTGAKTYTTYVKMHHRKELHEFFREHKEWSTEKHYDLLRYSGATDEELLWSMFLPIGSVLIGIIIFGSVSLIYNAFAISVSERRKQFGVLGSVGATKKQLKKSVLFEGVCLCVVGVPLGIAAGVAGIWVTFRCTAEQFARIGNSDEVKLLVRVPIAFLGLAALLAFATVMLSAYLPARRAVRIHPIESIRQTTEIAIRGKQVRSPKWVYRVFGFEGMLANKNFRRNKKKYRATVFSLFLSVVLFISAGSVCDYMEKALDAFAREYAHDMEFRVEGVAAEESPELLKKELLDIEGMKEVVYSGSGMVYVEVPRQMLSEEYLAQSGDESTESASIGCSAYFIEDNAYRELLRSLNRNPEEYFREDNPKVLFVDTQMIWTEDGRKKEMTCLKDNGTVDISVPYGESTLPFGTFVFDTKVNEPHLGIHYIDGFQVLFPYSRYEKLHELTGQAPTADTSVEEGEEATETQPKSILYYYMTVDSQDKAYEGLVQLLGEKGLSTSSLTNIAAEQESERALIVINNVFSYGFIVLISLIAMANVFNTVSTNVLLRRREFAMLRSVGMTQKGFRRMMNYECVLYGVKGLMYGLPVALGITYLLYLGVSNGVDFAFFLPWSKVAIAVGSVFLVVFASMLYATGKLRGDNTMDVIKNENL